MLLQSQDVRWSLAWVGCKRNGDLIKQFSVTFPLTFPHRFCLISWYFMHHTFSVLLSFLHPFFAFRSSVSSRRAPYVLCYIEALLCNHYCSGKVMSITQPVCVFVALSIQHAMRMRHIAYPALLHFSTLSHKRHDYRKKLLNIKMCVSSFSITFVWNVFHS
jgi:hypothetical protein